MVALYGAIVSFITLLFQYIDTAFPDPAITYYTDPYSGAIRFAMAALIVLVPVSIVLLRLIRNDIARFPEKSDLWVRRWALFLTLFIAGATVVVDLITLVNTFLGGELTARFILKVLVVLLVAGAVFMHFLADLWGYWGRFPSRASYVGAASGVAAIAAIVGGFFIIGSPSDARLMRLDFQRVSDLQNIQWQVVNYWQQKEDLPPALADLQDSIGGYVIPVDPETGEPYTYEQTGELSFRLCAVFAKEGDSQDAASRARIAAPVKASLEPAENNWRHGEGEQCFERTIDPERYPPYEKPAVLRATDL